MRWVSNASIRERVAETALSEKIMEQKMKYVRKIAEREPDDPVRKCIFEAGSTLLKRTETARKRGRPRETWIDDIRDQME